MTTPDPMMNQLEAAGHAHNDVPAAPPIASYTTLDVTPHMAYAGDERAVRGLVEDAVRTAGRFPAEYRIAKAIEEIEEAAKEVPMTLPEMQRLSDVLYHLRSLTVSGE